MKKIDAFSTTCIFKCSLWSDFGERAHYSSRGNAAVVAMVTFICSMFSGSVKVNVKLPSNGRHEWQFSYCFFNTTILGCHVRSWVKWSCLNMEITGIHPPFKGTSSQAFFCLVSFISLTFLNPAGALPLLVGWVSWPQLLITAQWTQPFSVGGS